MGLWPRITSGIQEARGYRERLLLQKEEDQARKVFQDTLPYGKIYLSNGLGTQSAPYTIPYPGRWGCYLIHIGPNGFENPVARNGRTGIEFTFIHELAHGWQGDNNRFLSGYVFNSLWHQGKALVETGSRVGAYAYTPGQAWRSYSVEQQANIVEDWWRIGGRQSDNDPLWPYIRDNIRGLQT